MTPQCSWRTAAVLLAAVAVETLLLGLVPGAWRGLLLPGGMPVPAADRAGTLVSSALLLPAAAAWTYWCLVLVLTAGGITRRLLVPAAWRAAAAAALGVAVATGTAAAAAADPAETGPPASASTGLDGLPLPDRPVGGPPSRVRPPDHVTVRPGDTFWELAAGALPATATDSVVDHTWRAWYAANRRTVGPDPDLLLPGQRLVAPDHPQPWRNPR